MENKEILTRSQSKIDIHQRKPLDPIHNYTNRSIPTLELKNPGNMFVEKQLYPDQVLNVRLATLGEKQRGKMKNKDAKRIQKENISRAVCALLNSGGGIALVEYENEDFNYKEHGLGQDIEQALSLLVSFSTSVDYYDVLQGQSFLYIFVKTWSVRKDLPKLCSVDTGLYVRQFTSHSLANSAQVLECVEKKTKGKGKKARRCSVADLQLDLIKKLLDKPYLCKGDTLGMAESEHVEFKDYPTENIKKRMNAIILPYFSAFGNTDGGCLIIGVDDNGTINGCGSHFSKDELQKYIEKLISKAKIVHLDDCDSNDQFYNLTIKDVRDKDGINSGFVIFLCVDPLCCLAFVDDPQSWKLDHLKEKRLAASEWIPLLTNKCSDPSLESMFERLDIKERPPCAKPVYRKKGLENLQELQSNLFGSLEEKVTIKPDNLYSELKAELPELEGILKTLVENEEGVIILSRSWAVDLEESSNPNVMCDVLQLFSGKHPKLFSLVKGEISQTEVKYVISTAFTLKKKLVDLGAYTGKLCVIPDILQLNSENQKPSFSMPNVTYPETYILDGYETVKELLQSLLIVMVSFRSYLSGKIGTEYFKLLTTEQYNVLSRTFFKGPFFVHGPPGTGKTVVALKIIEKIKNNFNCSTDKILFICENTPLRDYVRKQSICEAVTRCTFEKRAFPNVEHIIADEAQNFRCEESNWFEKAKQIIKKAGGEGVFYIFLDNFQSCHTKSTGLPPLTQQNKHILSKVVRSPEKIYNCMFETMGKIASQEGSLFMKEIMNKQECCHGVSGLYKQLKNIDVHSIVRYVGNTCKKYLREGYAQRDIAILCNTADAVSQYRPLLEDKIKEATKKLRTRVKPFETAENIKNDVIVIDSVRRFSGLERPVVFAINPVSWDPLVFDNVFLCAASRATANLHVLFEPSISW